MTLKHNKVFEVPILLGSTKSGPRVSRVLGGWPSHYSMPSQNRAGHLINTTWIEMKLLYSIEDSRVYFMGWRCFGMELMHGD